MIRRTIIAGAVSLGMALAFSCSSDQPELECYLVQMHIHAHSNHNGNDLPASMQWHCAQAASQGFDVIWWTDHAELFDTFEDMDLSLKNAFFEEGQGYIDLSRTRSRRRLSRLDLEGAIEGLDVGTSGGVLDLTFTSSGGPEFESVRVTPASARGPVKTVEWCRPVTSGALFEIPVDVTGLGADSFLRFGFDLAAHPGGRHHLLFDVIPAGGSEPQVVGDTLVIIQMEVADFPSRLRFDLEDAAAHLPNGLDNTFNSLYIEFGARNGAALEVKLDSLRLVSRRPSGENQFRVVKELAKRYDSMYGITEYIGVEASGIHTPDRPHMNAYFPEDKETLANLIVDPTMERTEWAKWVTQLGGLVSLNHPFGAALRPAWRGLESFGDTTSLINMANAVGPIPGDDLWAVARPIIETGGMGCSILEVGYIFRGTASLSDHLRLWDLVLAHGVRLVGNGVSDAHGGVWGPDLRPNTFGTWIWARGKDRSHLLESLRAGSVCFGDPFQYGGHLAFGVEDAFMGDTLRVRSGDEPVGWIRLEPWVDGADVRLVQVRIGAGREPSYIRRESLAEPGRGFALKVEEACFARIEVYGPAGEPLIFSNPVWLIPEY